MHDIKWIRENPEAFDAGLARRAVAAMSADILALDKNRREAEGDAQQLQSERNALAKEIGVLKGRGEDAAPLIEKVSQSKKRQGVLEERAKALGEELRALLATIPNLAALDVPDGTDEGANVEVRRWSEPRNFNFPPREHFELGEALGMMDFETAAKMSGARFVLLSGALARMERALGAFMIDHNTQQWGYREVSPPALVRANALYGTGQLPKFAEDLFHTEDDYFLIPTAEVPLTNILADTIIGEDTLPRRYSALTWCFRSEAGSAGKDTRGMIRQHQFAKVEMVSVVAPEHSAREHERMSECAEDILKQLKIPFRTVVLCTGDMGFSAQKTYDIEVWLPGQGAYREISSCSNTGDFQARRMNARYRPQGAKKTRFVHTLNGSGLAVGRALIAVIENYQQEDGSIVVPDVLRPYMGGLEVIEVDAG